jgi:hypothetical protein
VKPPLQHSSLTILALEPSLQHSNLRLSAVEHPLQHSNLRLSAVKPSLQHSNLTISAIEPPLKHSNLRFSAIESPLQCSNLTISVVKPSPSKQFKLMESEHSPTFCRTSAIMSQKVEEIVSSYENTLANIDALIAKDIVQKIISQTEIAIVEQEAISLILKMSKEFQNFASSQR